MTGKTDVVVKLALVFFISLLSFAIGTFVGKKYSDNVHKTASLETGHKAESNTEVASEHKTDAKASQNLSDEEIAKLTEEFVSDDAEQVQGGHEQKTADAHGNTEKTEEVAHKDAEPAAHSKKEEVVAKHEATPAAAKEDKHEKTQVAAHSEKTDATHEDTKNPPEEPKKIVATKPHADETRQPSSIPKDLGQYAVGKYTVQIGSFNSEEEAKEKVNTLKEQGFSAYFFAATIKGKTWYRVSVGLFASETEAKKYKADFSAKTNINSAYIQKISQ